MAETTTPTLPAPAAAASESVAFVARQPILTGQLGVHGYELLFRSGLANAYSHHDGNQATCMTINTSLNKIGLAELVNGKKAFVNVTRQFLLEELYTVLPKESAVIELLETVKPDDEVVAACRALRDAGYSLALDDFVFSEEYERLMELADIIKVDLRITPRAEWGPLVEAFGRPGLTFLAEKVETQEEYEEAKRLGYTLFQGYFFCKPQIIQGREITGDKRNYLLFLQEVNRTPMDYGRLEKIVKSDASLSVKLLRYTNSASLGVREAITSIKHALVLLGERPLRKWASLVAVTCLGSGKSPELIRISAVRGEFCELLSSDLMLDNRKMDLFLLGLLSVADGLTDCPLAELLRGMPISVDVTATLLGQETSLRNVLDLSLACERGDWQWVSALASQLGISESRIGEAYARATRFGDTLAKM